MPSVNIEAHRYAIFLCSWDDSLVGQQTRSIAMIHKKTTKKLYHHHNSTPSLYNVAKSSILLFSYAKRDVLLTIDNFFYWTGSNVWRAGERACLGVRRYKRRVGSCAPPSPYIFRGVTNASSSPSSGHHEVPGKNHLNKWDFSSLCKRQRPASFEKSH